MKWNVLFKSIDFITTFVAYFKNYFIRLIVRLIYFIAFLIFVGAGLNSLNEIPVASYSNMGEVSLHSSHKNLMTVFLILNDAIESKEEDQEIDELSFFESILLEERQVLCCIIVPFPKKNTSHKFLFLNWMEEKKNLPPPYSV